MAVKRIVCYGPEEGSDQFHLQCDTPAGQIDGWGTSKESAIAEAKAKCAELNIVFPDVKIGVRQIRIPASTRAEDL